MSDEIDHASAEKTARDTIDDSEFDFYDHEILHLARCYLDLRRENAELRVALEKYGRHLDERGGVLCDFLWTEGRGACTCGLDAALNRTQDTSKETKMDTRSPHDILPEDEIPKGFQKHFVPVDEADAERLKGQGPTERAAYLQKMADEAPEGSELARKLKKFRSNTDSKGEPSILDRTQDTEPDGKGE